MANVLTRAEFAKTPAARKPGASYGGYVNWVTKTRARRQATRASDPFGTAMSGLTASLQTPAQQQASVNQLVNSGINSGVAGINAASAAARTTAENQATRAQGFAAALAALTKDDPTAIRDTYMQQADFLKGLGTGLTGSLQQAQQQVAGEQQAKVAALGAPEIKQAFNPADLRSSLQYSGVVLPASDIAGQAANALQEAQSHRAADVAGIGDIAQSYLQKVADLKGADATQIAALQATRPDLLLKAQTQVRGEQQSALNSILQGGYLKSSLRQAGAGLTGVDPKEFGGTGKPTLAVIEQRKQDKIAQQKLVQDQNQFLASQRAKAVAGLKPNSQLSKAVGYLVDSNGSPLTSASGRPVLLPGYKFDATGNVIKDPAATAKAGVTGTGVTPAQIQSFLTSITGTPRYETQSKHDPATGQTTTNRVQVGTNWKITFPQALRRLKTWGGLNDAQARQYLQSVYPRGEGGRAWLTNEEQSALKAAGRKMSGPGAGAAFSNVHKSPSGSAFLTSAQYNALAQLGQPPSGHWGTDPSGSRVWWIT